MEFVQFVALKALTVFGTRPVTVTQGTNTVVGCDPGRIVTEALAILDGKGKAGRGLELWDGQAARRIVEVLEL